MTCRRLVTALLALSVGACASGESSSQAAVEDGGAPVQPEQGVYGMAPAAAGGVPSVIMLNPVGETSITTETESPATIDQFGLTFSPARLLTHLGDTIAFSNSESAVAHNVRIRAFTDRVDILDADANPGERLTVTLPTPGGYDVVCDMHPGMTAFIFASDAVWSVFAEPDGTFLLDGVPPGTYSLQLWTAAGGFHDTRSIEVTVGSTGIDLSTSG